MKQKIEILIRDELHTLTVTKMIWKIIENQKNKKNPQLN